MEKPKWPSSAQRFKTLSLVTMVAITNRYFIFVLMMDLMARTGYQLGKSPVLPLFADSLGAGPQVSGAIVAVSTTTGLITSPLIGTLSDLYGRRRMLIVGTALFAFVPFVYLFVETPGQLLLVRLVHGFSTAIYGPVAAALVADMFQQRRAEYMGWYRSVRTSSYLLGPLLGGFILHYADFSLAWIAVGVLGLAALVPALALPRESVAAEVGRKRPATWAYLREHLLEAFRNSQLVALGIVEASLYLGLRANKAFLPLYALSVGINPAQVGLLFGIQVAATLIAQPVGGRASDRLGRKTLILVGLALAAAALPLMVTTDLLAILALLAVVLGLSEAAIMPSVITLGTELSDSGRYGSTLGMLDAMDNVGKALGPITAGLLLGVFSYQTSFVIISGLLLCGGLLFCFLTRDTQSALGQS